MKTLIYLVGGSIRSRKELETLENGCNSEIALSAVRNGIREISGEVKYLRLNRYFLRNGTSQNIAEAVEKLQEADGIVFATPVYFGVGSSLIYEFLEFCKEHNVSLYGKVVGFAVVGAKRNGGEETTIAWLAWEVMDLGALVVNDGAPVSQFGGVGVAGTWGQMKYDREGLETCKNLGKRVAETALILKSGNLETEPNIRTWVMSGSSPEENALNLFEMNFHRCWGCEICPSPSKTAKGMDFKCRNEKDDMHKVHPSLVSSEGIVPVGWNMRFLERTRYLRRDNYRLTYSVVLLPQIRYLPIFIKENSMLCRRHFRKYASLVKSGKERVGLTTQKYEPVGYTS